MPSDHHVIMLVEDDPDDEALTVRALRRAHVSNDIVVARDGVEALDYLFGTGSCTGRDPHDVAQVVLLDLKLPRVDGLEVLRRIRADTRTQCLPVVILISSSEDRERVDGLKLGVNSYVRKPVAFTEFVDVVRQLGLYWLLLNPPSDGAR